MEKPLEHRLDKMDENKKEIVEIFKNHYGEGEKKNGLIIGEFSS